MPPKKKRTPRTSTRAPLKAPIKAPVAAAERALSVEVIPAQLEETLRSLAEDIKHWANKGRYTKVRFKFRGKPLLPDLPLAAVVAAEGLTFYWGGILRALVMNFAGKSLLQVELVHDAEKKILEGKQTLLEGDLESSIALFREAVEMDRGRALAHLNLGIAFKLKGERDAARRSLESARDLDPKGLTGAEAERLLKGMMKP